MPNASRRRSLRYSMDDIDIPELSFRPEIFLKLLTLTAAAKLLALIALFTVPIYALFGRSKRQRLLENVPIVGLDEAGTDIANVRLRFRHGSKAMLLEGYRKHKGGLFYVPTAMGERLMIPPKYIEELKNAPAEQADFPATFIEMFEGQITTIGTEQTLHPRVIKNQLNQYLPSIMSEVDEEIRSSLAALIPRCEDWTQLNIAEILTRVVARASSRMFGGTILSEHEAWTNTMIDFTGDSFLAAQRLKDFPYAIRYVMRYFIPEVKKIFEHFSLADRLIGPILTERSEPVNVKKKNDLIQWMLDQREHRSDTTLAHINLHVAFAAIHTSAVAITHIIYDLCAMPEYVEPLREEISKALKEEGAISKKALLKMSKLDSFMRESQRFNPLLLITYERLVRKDLRLSDGLTIPANTQVGVPAHAIGFDPENYIEPDTFKGFRFHELRQADPQRSGQNQYVAANLSNMSWGYGSHACPGRWFADAEIKMMLIHLLLDYDFKLPPGKERPGSLEFETQNLPDKTATVMLKKRVV